MSVRIRLCVRQPRRGGDAEELLSVSTWLMSLNERRQKVCLHRQRRHFFFFLFRDVMSIRDAMMSKSHSTIFTSVTCSLYLSRHDKRKRLVFLKTRTELPICAKMCSRFVSGGVCIVFSVCLSLAFSPLSSLDTGKPKCFQLHVRFKRRWSVRSFPALSGAQRMMGTPITLLYCC